jgi:hypothetical protein
MVIVLVSTGTLIATLIGAGLVYLLVIQPFANWMNDHDKRVAARTPEVISYRAGLEAEARAAAARQGMTRTNKQGQRERWDNVRGWESI